MIEQSSNLQIMSWKLIRRNLLIIVQLGTVNLCRSVIRSIETARIFDFEEFPVRDKVCNLYELLKTYSQISYTRFNVMA